MNVPIEPFVPGALVLVAFESPSVLPVKVIAPPVMVLKRLTYCALALPAAKPSSTVKQTSSRCDRLGDRLGARVKDCQRETMEEERCIWFSLSKH